MSVQLTAFNKLHEEVNAEIILINIVHTYNERMIDTIEDVFLKLQAIEEVLL